MCAAAHLGAARHATPRRGGRASRAAQPRREQARTPQPRQLAGAHPLVVITAPRSWARAAGTGSDPSQARRAAADSTCMPHPAQVGLPHLEQVTRLHIALLARQSPVRASVAASESEPMHKP
eukprot:CAMPEP_0202044696 /NCGR_PEP_ID=MMETSP0963-20130614/201_1 /ASSEMBLY_ACC=CAM_ASM_000494 /TAXON_ID=4773 /ORGANISM="Schizochytrium aggregatum, Strain ATCC28209" /LENGTH=121 /DNA_ID=CAMNT_0048609227 /DNA_START=35 /DNA_END=395 /DNA_ORIENTATION=+